MKIKFKETAYTSAGRVDSGQQVDLKDAEAKDFIARGLALPAEVEAPKTTTNRQVKAPAKRKGA